MSTHRSRCLTSMLFLAAVTIPFRSATASESIGRSLADATQPLVAASRTGVVYDRVLPLAHLERLDGSAAAPAVDAATWLQGYDELRRAGSREAIDPAPATLVSEARATARGGVIPLALFDRAFERVRPDAVTDGSIVIDGGRIVRASAAALTEARAVAAAALVPRSYHGARVTFALDARRCFADALPRAIEIDFADGRGLTPVALGERVTVGYAEPGRRTLRLRLTRDDGSSAETRFAFDVAALAAPAPDDTLHVTATVPYQGQLGTGDAYVYLAPGHASLLRPIVVIEGFDLDNSMNWDELYELLNQENLIETLRADGFDAVVLNFTDATEAIQKNAFVVAELILEVQAAIAPDQTLALVGASMGGLCSRYALTWFEQQGIPYRVRTWISFDAPQAGADIPLGLQYWIQFFSGQSADAAEFLAILNRPAARQMLLQHFTDPPGTTGEPDPMRAALLADLASIGDWPALTRRVAIVNGSGQRQTQGFAAGAQLIRWEYSSAFVAITGNVWAVPDHVNGQIFRGSTRILFSTTTRNVSISNSPPWDGSPGGSRASLAELDSTAAPYGDIVALHPSHCFIPAISALALDTTDPFYDIAGDPDPLAHTPFDAIYWPAANQGHVLITPENAVWVRNEIESSLLGVPGGRDAGTGAALAAAAPNPFTGELRLTLALPVASSVELSVLGVDGRHVRRLMSGRHAAGRVTVAWDGRDGRDARVAPGIYFIHLRTGDDDVVRRVVTLD